jgi:F-type H+-transporting ATPase subunit b
LDFYKILLKNEGGVSQMTRFALKWISYSFVTVVSTFFLLIISDVNTASAAGGISVYPDKSLIIQIANFVVLIWALNKVLYRPIRNVLHQRKEKITGMEQHIDDFNTDIEEKDKAFEAGIKDARVKGLKEKEGLVAVATDEEKAIIEEINKKAKEELAEVLDKIAKDAEEARKSLQNEIDDFVKDIGQKILGRAV